MDPSRFQHLSHLALWSSPNLPGARPICPTAVRQLLAPARRLSHLLLQGMGASVDDQMLAHLWQGDNPMEELESLVLDQCHQISVCGPGRNSLTT